MIESQIAADLNPWWNLGTAFRHPAPNRRDLQPRILSQILDFDNRRATVVVGPRQVGKTVLLQQTAEDLIRRGWPARNVTYFDFSHDQLPLEGISARAVQAIDPGGVSTNHRRIFLLDEIGKSQSWDAWLKQAVDTGHDRFLVSDSAATLLREGGRESGQGRWVEEIMEPLSFTEHLRLAGIDAQHALNLPQDPFEAFLSCSGFPEHSRNDDYPKIREHLREDILARAIRRDLLKLQIDLEKAAKLFTCLLQDSGSLFHAMNRANDLKVDRRSVSDWLEVFGDTMLVQFLSPFLGHSAKVGPRLSSMRKVYAVDHGLVAAFSPSAEPLQHTETRGRMYETMVFRQLREEARSLRGGLFYYRSKTDLEADFVFEHDAGRVVIEVTSGRDPTKKLAALREVGVEVSAHRHVLVHGGHMKERSGTVLAVPIAAFLLNPRASLLGEEDR